MDSHRFARIKEILLQVLPLSAESRSGQLDALCGEDTELRSEVEALLRQEEGRGGLVETGAAGLAGAPKLRDAIEEIARRREPTHIGGYEILGRLGEGGMGVVYRARQSEPIEREVAIKLIRAGYAQERIVARFEWERRSLARMDHPNIARVFDAGADSNGHPFVVMELIEGLPIDLYCRTHRLGLGDRLQLFLRTCRGVQHAHERGVLHRDLKPGNILVREIDGKPTPAIIDFGIAKALDPDPQSEGLLTREDQRIGTPSYMSPEQLRGDASAVDIRSDVYALGVILFELLTGSSPFATGSGSYDELERGRSREDLTAPSGVPGDVDPSEVTPGFRRALRGDLDVICLKAIRPERGRRYATVAQFIDDIERYLDDRPISARPDSFAYRLGKLRRRHPVAVVLSAASLLFVVSGIGFLGFHAERLERERDRATAEAEKARATADFLEALFTDVDPTKGGAAELSAKELLFQGTARLEEDLAGQPGIRAGLLQVIGRAYHGLDLLDSAEGATDDALAALDELPPSQERDFERGAVLLLRGTVHHDLSQLADSESDYREAVSALRRAEGGGGAQTALALSYLATAVQAQGNLEAAIPALEESIRMGVEHAGASHPDVIWARNMLGYVQYKRGDYGRALEMFEETLAAQRSVSEGDDVDLAHTLNNMGGMYFELERFDDAEDAWSEAHGMYERIYGEAHPAIARALHQLARIYRDTGRLDLAEDYARRSIAMHNATRGPEHPKSTQPVVILASLHERAGDVESAERLLRECIRVRAGVLGAADASTLEARRQLAELMLRSGRAQEAESMLEDLLEQMFSVHGEEHPLLNQLRVVAAEAALARNDGVRAAALLQSSSAALESIYDEEHSWRRRWSAAMARL